MISSRTAGAGFAASCMNMLAGAYLPAPEEPPGGVEPPFAATVQERSSPRRL